MKIDNQDNQVNETEALLARIEAEKRNREQLQEKAQQEQTRFDDLVRYFTEEEGFSNEAAISYVTQLLAESNLRQQITQEAAAAKGLPTESIASPPVPTHTKYTSKAYNPADYTSQRKQLTPPKPPTE